MNPERRTEYPLDGVIRGQVTKKVASMENTEEVRQEAMQLLRKRQYAETIAGS